MRKINAKRIVVKIGTNTLTKADGSLNYNLIENIAKDISKLDKEFIIVTSGAIGSGCKEIGLQKRPRDIKLRQACAAIGQSSVMQAYHNAFAKFGLSVAQILLTYEDFSDRKKYLNLRNSVNELIKLKVIPVINENDVISTAEIDASFGDNDKLSALVASKIEADLLIMLSDIDGLYDKNPKTNKDARLISKVSEITRDIERSTAGKGSVMAVGGMKSKIESAKITMESGCNLIILNGKEKNVISRTVKGEEIGTLFVSKKGLSNKERWIMHSKAKGKIIVNKCAEKVLLDGCSSLLSIGVDQVEGDFEKGDVIKINDFAKAISDLSSNDIDRLKGKKGKVIVKCENMVLTKGLKSK